MAGVIISGFLCVCCVCLLCVWFFFNVDASLKQVSSGMVP